MIVILKHAKDPPVSIKECRPELPDAICSLIMSMLQKDPDSRPQNMKTILMDVQSLSMPATLNQPAPISPQDMPATIVERPEAAAPPAPAEISSRSSVLVGQEGKFKAKRFSVAVSGTTTIGRLSDNDIVMPDETISRQHCAIEAKGKGFILRDKGSSNGCRINGEKVTEGTVSAGDSVRIGKVDFKFFVMAVSEDAYQLAELLVQRGLLSPKEAKDALNELAQERNRKAQSTLGQILVEGGKLSGIQLDDSLGKLDSSSKRNYTVKVRLVKTSGPAAPTRGNPIPDAIGGQKTSVIRRPEFEKPMPLPSEGDEMELLDDAAPPAPRPAKPTQSPEPPPEPATPEPTPVPDFSDAELSLDDQSSPSPQPAMSSEDDDESAPANLSGFVSEDSLFGQVSVCSKCKEIIMMSDVTSGEAKYVNSKLYCMKCAAAQ